jgi:hypothetical protein
MKNYLNQEERKKNTLICVMFAIVEELMQRANGSKEEITNLKYAHTYLQKYITSLIKRVGYEEGNRIWREARDSYVQIKPKVHEDDGQQLVDKECMEGMAEKCLKAYCFGCKREDWRNCELCKYMKRLGIETIYGFEDRCTYWYPEGGFDPDYTEDKE